MRFLEIVTFYPDYLRYFYDKYPFAVELSYRDQIDLIVKDGFSCSNIYAPYLPKFGFTSELVIANNFYTQNRWCKENGLIPWMQPQTFEFPGINLNLVKQQIENFKPDVLFLNNPTIFHKPFFDKLNFKPKLVLAWLASFIPKNLDLSDYDLFLSNSQECLDLTLQLGARNALFFQPAIPEFFSELVWNFHKIYDIAFVGQITREHKKRESLLIQLVRILYKNGYDLNNCAFHFSGIPNNQLPKELKELNRGKIYGFELFKTFRQAKICLNIDIDYGKGGNFRLFEVTSVGSFLLSNENENTHKYFVPGKEIDTFKNADDMYEKIKYYLANEAKREEIAQNAYQKFLKKYSMNVRIQELVEIIETYLKKKHFDNSNTVEIVKTREFQNSSYEAGKSHVISPLTEENSILIGTIRTFDIINEYRISYQINVEKYFNNVHEVKLFQCPTTKLQFFFPYHLAGDGEFYAQLSKIPWYYIDNKWEHQIAYNFIKSNSEVLEIGCGKGSFLKQLLLKNCNVVGLEINPMAQNSNTGVTILNETIEKHSITNSSKYDYVCMFQLLGHSPNIKEFLNCSINVLKNNGYLIISVPNQDSFISLDKFNIFDMPPHHMSRWTPEVFQNLEKIFPIRLIDIKYEPLETYHFEWFERLIRNNVTNKQLSMQIIEFAKRNPEYIKGHTILGIFQKAPK
jgi:2-polyprenyl-3-methyl-5-hydroxy-6-metoxy-1,4-benzoquinol methylase/glycosyltransferase involved in cell wall biosynthesis